MFCGGKKEKDKKKQKQLPQQIDLNDPNICKTHKQPYDSICMDPNWNHKRKLCGLCKSSINASTFALNDLKNKIQQQDTFDLVDHLEQKLPKDWDQGWRMKMKEFTNTLKQTILKIEEGLLCKLLIKDQIPSSFSEHDLNLMFDHKVLEEILDLVNQRKSFETVENDDSIYILAKLIQNSSESKRVISLIESDSKPLIQKMLQVQDEIENKIDSFKKSLQSIANKFEQNQVMNPDPVFNFITNTNNTNDTITQQHLVKIQQRQKLSVQQNFQQSVEQTQVKSIVLINDSFFAYSSNCNKIHLLKLPELQEVSSLEEDFDIYALGKGMIKGEVHLLASVDDDNGKGLLNVWSLTNMTKLFSIPAHNSTIWKIIQLPSDKIATCSEDTTVKIFSLDQKKEINCIQIHQASVNDVALVSTSLIASVSDDQILALSEFETGQMQAMSLDDCEIKCVVGLDGSLFVTGNSNGFVTIYQIEKSQVIELAKIKVHENMIRNIGRINSKIVVTSSWDGFHCFYDIETRQSINMIEGPLKNFTEGMLWINSEKILVAGVGGRLAIYR